MKTKLLLLSVLLSSLCASTFAQSSTAVTKSIKMKIDGLEDEEVYLSYYYGKRQYYKDTAKVNSDGSFEFSGEEYEGGIYSVIFQDKRTYFELVVTEPYIEMETSMDDLINSMKVIKSKENKIFFDYLQYSNGIQKNKLSPLKKELRELEELEETTQGDLFRIEELKNEIKQADQDILNSKEEVIKSNPDAFIAKVFKASKDPDVIKCTADISQEECEKLQYREFKKHFFDNLDFKDERLLRTPVYHNRISYYLEKLTYQSPDSILKEADWLIDQIKHSDELYKYTVHYITSTFESKKIMGMDKVWVKMGLKYYCPDKAPWMKEDKLAEFCERCATQNNLLIGVTAPDFTLWDKNGKEFTLSKHQSKYTLLIFWDKECGHCKKVLPQFNGIQEDLKKLGVSTVGIVTSLENEDWIEYADEKGFNWINVSDTPEKPNKFRTNYDLFSTPQVYVLDKDKTIIGKKLTADQMVEFLEDYIERNK